MPPPLPVIMLEAHHRRWAEGRNSMPITRMDFDRLSEADLERLRENEVAEGIDLDYKLKPYGTSDADKKEFLKDVSSFANTAGGDIIVGLREADGLPAEVVGVDGDLDAEVLRLESLLRDRMEPRIIGIRMRPVPLANGRRVLVIRVPKSWNPPHAVLQTIHDLSLQGIPQECIKRA
jgi:predicted HTH transcriptional regulator